MLMPYWIQRADYSCTNYDPVDVEGAVKAFNGHDWQEELRLQHEIENREVRKFFGLFKAKPDWCPPGIGFCPADKRFLHIMLMDEHYVTFFCDYDHESAEISYAEAAEAIRRFFAGDREWLMDKCR